MLKKIITLIITLFFLASCGSNEVEDVSDQTKIDLENFSISIPNDWDEIDKTSESLPTPKNGEIEFAGISQELKYGFSNNILILSQDVTAGTTSTDFSTINNVGSTKDYLSYEKLDSKAINFGDGDNSILYIFEAKYNTQTPVFKYLQTAKVCDAKAYLITIALSQDVKDTTDYEDIISSFECN